MGKYGKCHEDEDTANAVVHEEGDVAAPTVR